MGIEKLTERQVIGEFFKALEQDIGVSWVGAISNYFTSDQASEEYAWLGQTPQLREWIGGRNAKGFRESSQTIRNLHYESTIDILIKNLRRDKSGQALLRIAEMAQRTNAHWASLLSTLILSGPSTDCYDGDYFFDTDHEEGDSGAQSNDISVDISNYPSVKSGSTTLPSVEDMQWAIMAAITAIAGFKDDQGEPMNENVTSFLVMVPPTFYLAALQAMAIPIQSAGQTALDAIKGKFNIEVEANTRLSTWTTSFAVFRSDSKVKPLIRQEEMAIDLKVKGYGSEYEFNNDAHQYGIDTWRNVGFGLWQHACYVTLT